MTQPKCRLLMIKAGLALVLVLAMSGTAAGFDLDSLLTQSVGGPPAVETLQETSTFYISGPATGFDDRLADPLEGGGRFVQIGQ